MSNHVRRDSCTSLAATYPLVATYHISIGCYMSTLLRYVYIGSFRRIKDIDKTFCFLRPLVTSYGRFKFDNICAPTQNDSIPIYFVPLHGSPIGEVQIIEESFLV